MTVNGQTQGDDADPAESGRYTVSNNTVTFDPAGNDPEEPNYTATRSGNSLTLSRSDAELGVSLTIVARKQ